jgi:SAM-dependent methyltransferase
MSYLRQLVPDWAKYRYRRLRRLAEHAVNRQRTPEQVFSRIYEDGLWGKRGKGFDSGTGSVEGHAAAYVQALARYIEQHLIRRVVDLGCGDFTVGQKIVQLGVDYTGVDVVPALIEHHSAQYGSERVRFKRLDIVSDTLPEGDLCLIRQVLQHLSNEQIGKILPNLARYRHVLITEHYPAHGTYTVPNLDKTHGHDTRIEDDSAVFLDQPPFNARVGETILEQETYAVRRPGEMLRTFRLMT